MNPSGRRAASHLRVVPDLPAGPPDPVAVGRSLLELADPWHAEKAAAAFLADAERAGGVPQSVLGNDIPALEKKATRAALAMLLALGSIGGDEIGAAASPAARRLIDAGVRPPAWAEELAWSIDPTDAWRLYYADGTTTALNCTFHRGPRSHSILVLVDHLGGDVATDILDFDDDGLADAIDRLAELGRYLDAQVTLESPGKVAVRRAMEQALRTRAERDRAGVASRPIGEEFVAELPDYRAMTWLLRARMPVMIDAPRTLYDPTRPRLSLLPGGAENSDPTR